MPHTVHIYTYVTTVTCYWKTSKLVHFFKHPVMYRNAALTHMRERHKKPTLRREDSEESEYFWPGPAICVPRSLCALSRGRKEDFGDMTWERAILRNAS